LLAAHLCRCFSPIDMLDMSPRQASQVSTATIQDALSAAVSEAVKREAVSKNFIMILGCCDWGGREITYEVSVSIL